MSFLASLVFACISLFFAVITGFASSRFDAATGNDRKTAAHAIVFSAGLAILMMVAALMIAVSAK